jgi:hypothetical protein
MKKIAITFFVAVANLISKNGRRKSMINLAKYGALDSDAIH